MTGEGGMLPGKLGMKAFRQKKEKLKKNNRGGGHVSINVISKGIKRQYR